MFGLFKKKSPLDQLYAKYESLLSESKRLSTSNRKESDAKIFEASEVLKQIEILKSQS